LELLCSTMNKAFNYFQAILPSSHCRKVVDQGLSTPGEHALMRPWASATLACDKRPEEQ
jgi:hypothetical protein